MDLNLQEYGWDGNIIGSINTTANRLEITSDGFLYNKNTFHEKSGNVEVSGNFSFKGVDIGLLLWYNNMIDTFIFSTNGEKVELRRLYQGNESILQVGRLGDLGIPAPDNYDLINLKAVLKDDQILCYYNGTLVLEVEDAAFSGGYFGIYSKAEGICNEFSIDADSLSDWSYFTYNGCSIHTDNDRLTFLIPEGLTSGYSYINQEINITETGDYSASFDCTGSVFFEVYQLGSLIHSQSFSGADNERLSTTFNLTTTDPITISIGSTEAGNHFISYPQVEKKPFNTSYTSQARDDSRVTFPTKELNKFLGGMSFWIRPTNDFSSGTIPLFHYNDNFKLEYYSGNFLLTYGTKTVSLGKDIVKGQDYFISCSWENGSYLGINIHDEVNDTDHNDSIVLDSEEIEDSDFIYLGCTETTSGNFILDNLSITNGLITLDTLNNSRYSEDPVSPNTVLTCTFNESTLIYDNNKISVPIPRADSPIIVEDSQGIKYERVYFQEEGEYSLFNTIKYKYESNQIELEDKLASAKVIRESTGEEVESYIAGDQVNILGALEAGEEITLIYSLLNSFSIKYDQKLDQYYIRLSNLNGNGVYIYYEDLYSMDDTLLRQVELNPFKSSNHEGFIYVENTPRKLETFDIKISPDALVANGNDIATITIDCLSEGGAPTSNVSGYIYELNDADETVKTRVRGLNVKSSYGNKIERFVSEEENLFNLYSDEYGEEAAVERLGQLITEENRAGRFIYKYKAPGSIEEESIVDQITIYDDISGIGVQIPIRIVRE